MFELVSYLLSSICNNYIIYQRFEFYHINTDTFLIQALIINSMNIFRYKLILANNKI